LGGKGLVTIRVTKLPASDGSNLGTFAVQGLWPLFITFDGANIWVSNQLSPSARGENAPQKALTVSDKFGQSNCVILRDSCKLADFQFHS
jgi:hypothetical protein